MYGRLKLPATIIVAGAAILACGSLLGQRAESPDPKELFEYGQRCLTEGRYIEAEDTYSHLLTIGLRTAPVYTNLGVAYLRTGKLDSAIQVLKQAEQLAPQMSGIKLNLGLAYYRKREFKQAVPYFAAVISADPADIQGHYLKGVCHFMMDEFGPAVAELSPFQDREQGDLEYLFMLGVSYGKLGRADAAQQIFTRLTQAGGDTPHLHLLLGKSYLALANYEKAQPELEKAANDSHLPYSHYYLGLLYNKLGNLTAASVQFQEEIEMSPNDPWAYEDFSRIKLSQGDVDGVITLLRTAVERNPGTAILRSTLAKAYLRKSEPRLAAAQLEQAVALEPGNGNYHYQLGRAYAEAGRKKEAYAEMATARGLQEGVLRGQMEILSRDCGDHCGQPATRPQQ